MKEKHVFSTKYYAGRNKTRFIIKQKLSPPLHGWNILPIRRKTQNNQSINQSINQSETFKGLNSYALCKTLLHVSILKGQKKNSKHKMYTCKRRCKLVATKFLFILT